MSKLKGVFNSKPSKTSLRSRGLLSNTRSAPNESSVDGRYSLYSTDSEDNVIGVSRGLDKCAQLLTNILEINNEKGLKIHGSSHGKSQKRQLPGHHKTRKQIISSLVAKSDGNKMKHPKIKRKYKAIHVPTTVVNQASQEPPKKQPDYSKRVVASTPVLTPDQRKRQQELQERESVLQQQINQLQQQYDNLQAFEDPQSSKITKKKIDDVARKATEFTTNAEKPLVEGQNGPGKTTSEEPIVREAKKRVRIANQGSCDGHEIITEVTGTAEYSEENDHQGSQGQFEKATQNDVQKQTLEGTAVLKQRSPHRNTTDHLRILVYLIGELRAVLGNSDVEVERLLMEIENEIRLLSYPVQPHVAPNSPEKHCKQHDIDTEVALQPLRSENSDLRRKLRIANQRLRDMETRQTQEKPPPQNNVKEGLIENLHGQLVVEKERNARERQEKELAEKMIIEVKQEKKKLQIVLSKKDEEIEKLHKELLQQKEKTATVTSQMNLQLESSSVSLRARDKEVALLNLALEQRNTEIERLTELTRGLQQSLTKLLTNVQGLQPDDVISEVSSFNSLLDSFQPRGLKVTDLSVDLAASKYYTHHLGGNKHRESREYDKTKHDSSGSTMDTRDSYEHKSPAGSEREDSVSFLCSSEEESTFKQELASLDNAIARLQNNLRDKR